MQMPTMYLLKKGNLIMLIICQFDSINNYQWNIIVKEKEVKVKYILGDLYAIYI